VIGARVERCRSCGGGELAEILDLGDTPIANSLVDPDDAPASDERYPLGLVFCRSCSLVQLTYELPATAIFGEDYPYYSSFSDELCRHAAAHVEGLLATRDLGSDSFAVEVASNDGYLLRNFVAAGVPVLGIDPAPGPAAAANAAGVPTTVGFFGVELARQVVAEHGHADVIVANNVMAHVPELNDFVGGLATLLADDGVLTVENPWVRDMVEHCEYDTIYHEHYCYYSCSAVDALMRRHGLHLNDVDYFPNLHGGTLRWTMGKTDRRTPRCAEMLERERLDGMTGVGYYTKFADAVTRSQTTLSELLTGIKAQGGTIAGYGAAAKGATLLNCLGAASSTLDYVVDRNTHKVGKLMPGCRLPIEPVERLVDDGPSHLLLLAWNFADEIISQQAGYADSGGVFILPVPFARVVEGPSG